MQIASKYKLERIVDDEGPESYQYIHIGENKATVCDGRCLVVVPCAVGSGDCKGPITIDSLLYARQHSVLNTTTTLHLVDGETCVAQDSSVHPRSMLSEATEKQEQLELIRQPIDQVQRIDKISETVIPLRTGNEIVLSINARLLSDMAEAMGGKDEPIRLLLRPDDDRQVTSAVRVDGSEGAFGVIMPCRVGG